MANPEYMETGLRHRLKRVVRQMSDQHRHLRPIFAELAEAVARGDSVREAQERLAHYREAIEAHFTLESEMFFPALHGLHPDWEGDLERLDREHGALRSLLAEIGQAIERPGNGAPTALDRFAQMLRDHEKREELLVARLGSDGI